MVFNRAVSIATALVLSLFALTPARAEVGECDNKPGQCNYVPNSRRGVIVHQAPAGRSAPIYQRAAPVAQPQYRKYRRYEDLRGDDRGDRVDRIARSIAFDVGAAIISGIVASNRAHAADRE